LRIISNVSAINSYGQYGVNNRNSAKNVEGSSSGSRMRRADHSAMGVSVAGRLRSNNRGLSDSIRLAQEGISAIQTAESALKITKSNLESMRELAAKSADGSNKEVDRKSLDFDYTRFKFEICELGTVRFNGVDLIRTDSPVTLAFQTDSNAVNTTDVIIPAINADGLGNIGTAIAAEDAISNVGGAIAEVTNAIDSLGGVREQLQNSVRSRDVQAGGAESAGRDAGMAKKMIDSFRNELRIQSSAANMAQANIKPQGALQLLG